MAKNNRERITAGDFTDTGEHNSFSTAFSGSFNSRTPIKKTKSTKKDAANDKKRGKNHFDLYVTFQDVAGRSSLLAIGSRRLHTYFNNTLNRKDHAPQNKAANIKLNPCSDTKENPYDLRVEAIKKVIAIRDYSPASPEGKPKKTKGLLKAGDSLTIHTDDTLFHEMISETKPEASSALAAFKAIGAKITLKVSTPPEGCAHLESALATMKQHINEQETTKKNLKGKQNHRPSPASYNHS